MKHNLFAILMCIVVCFSWMSCESNGPDNPSNASKDLYIGVVAFNQGVRELSLTNDLRKAKKFIIDQENDKDFTAFAYAVSRGNMQFDAAELPKFDNIFMLNFSDGTDNQSNMRWGEEGRRVGSEFVYDTARYDLQQRVGLNSYALGFGAEEADFREKMQKIVQGTGSYYNAKSSNDLLPTFNEIAQAMLASAKNVVIKTNPGFFAEDLGYKYFRLNFSSEDGSKDVIYAKMEGTPDEGYTLSINKIENEYAYFDAPAKGTLNAETGKVHIPLNNLKFVKGGKELQFTYSIEVSLDGELYYTDVEEASTEEQVSKRIAVVLVLDCSTSMGSAFTPMKEAAVDFIEAMAKTSSKNENSSSGNESTTIENGTENGHEYVDLGLSVKWATCNVGASKPEEYGDYFAWGETKPKSEYSDWNYSYYTDPTILPLSADAARANWGGSWRMPTGEEIEEVLRYCTWTWTTENGVNGYRVTSNKAGYTDKSIFLPAAGYRYASGLRLAGSDGDYWSSSLLSGGPNYAYYLYFDSSDVAWYNGSRYYGRPVRPVCQ